MPATSHRARRSAQTAMFWIAEAMVRWLAPILSFTAEEIWRSLPGERPDSVFLCDVGGSAQSCLRRAAAIDWDALIELRAAVTRELEQLREQGAIGAPLDAEVDVYCAAEHRARLQRARRGAALRVHHVGRTRAPGRLRPAEDAVAAQNAGTIGRRGSGCDRSQATKCVRCWHQARGCGQRRASIRSFAGGASRTSTGPVKQRQLRVSDERSWQRPRSKRRGSRRRAAPAIGCAARRSSSSCSIRRPRRSSIATVEAARRRARCCRSSTSRCSTTPAPRSASSPAPPAGSAGSSSAWRVAVSVALILLAARSSRPGADRLLAVGLVADPRRRARQRHRPRLAWLRRRLHPLPLAALGLPRLQRRRLGDHHRRGAC